MHESIHFLLKIRDTPLETNDVSPKHQRLEDVYIRNWNDVPFLGRTFLSFFRGCSGYFSQSRTVARFFVARVFSHLFLGPATGLSSTESPFPWSSKVRAACENQRCIERVEPLGGFFESPKNWGQAEKQPGNCRYLGGGNSNLMFIPYLGKWSKLTIIFFRWDETTH